METFLEEENNYFKNVVKDAIDDITLDEINQNNVI